MKVGDKVQWQGSSRIVKATVESENGELIARLENGKCLPLRLVIKSKTFKSL